MSWIIIGGRTGLYMNLTRDGEPECKGGYCYHDSVSGDPVLAPVLEAQMTWTINVSNPDASSSWPLDKRVKAAPDHTHGMLYYGQGDFVQCSIQVPMRTFLRMQHLLQLVLTSPELEYLLEISFDFRREGIATKTPRPTSQEFAKGEALFFENAVSLSVRGADIYLATKKLIKCAMARFDNDRKLAVKWYREPVPAFNQLTPNQMVLAGRADDVMRYLVAMERMSVED